MIETAAKKAQHWQSWLPRRCAVVAVQLMLRGEMNTAEVDDVGRLRLDLGGHVSGI